jgi:hypothetical protein
MLLDFVSGYQFTWVTSQQGENPEGLRLQFDAPPGLVQFGALEIKFEDPEAHPYFVTYWGGPNGGNTH